MNTLKTFRFWLEPDPEIPQFKRLHWRLVDVSITDVLLKGIHPWMGPNQHGTLAGALVERLNADTAKIPDLVSLGHGYDLSYYGDYFRNDACRFQELLKTIQNEVYFVDGLTYLELVEIAKQRLRDCWSHTVARTLAESAHCGFQELRRFLKSKDRSVKLSSYEDVDGYNLGSLLSLEDFDHHDKLLVAEGIPSTNFRRASVLASFTDGSGRLRLVPEIRHVCVSVVTKSQSQDIDGMRVDWHVTQDGKSVIFRPDLANNLPKRRAAAEIARRWRTDNGELVFRTAMDRLAEMVEKREAIPSFPYLNYTSQDYTPAATVEVESSQVQAFRIGGYLTSRCHGDALRNVLREYGVSMTGNKRDLVKKLAKLAGERYLEVVPTLDGFFRDHRLIRIAATPRASAELPHLKDVRYLRNLLLTMYAIRHLRGNAILDAGHENTTYTVEELAFALLTERVTFTGAFLPAT